MTQNGTKMSSKWHQKVRHYENPTKIKKKFEPNECFGCFEQI
jgi:hypothetical protein